MKLENLNRAKDLLAMKNTALHLITRNTEALEYMKKYTWDSGLYDVLNYGFENPSYYKIEEEFNEICKKYNKFYELGNTWNLSLYDL